MCLFLPSLPSSHPLHACTRTYTYILSFIVCFFFKSFIYLIVSGYAGLHCCVQAFSSCDEWELLSSCGAQASRLGGFSCCR